MFFAIIHHYLLLKEILTRFEASENGFYFNYQGWSPVNHIATVLWFCVFLLGQRLVGSTVSLLTASKV
jgi:hypothetical protein